MAIKKKITIRHDEEDTGIVSGAIGRCQGGHANAQINVFTRGAFDAICDSPLRVTHVMFEVAVASLCDFRRNNLTSQRQTTVNVLFLEGKFGPNYVHLQG